jgi:hypothetical protein
MFASAEAGRVFFQLLLKIDRAECDRVQALGCPDCGSPLDRGDHERKLRAGPLQHLAVGLRRANLCCRHCRHRRLPESAVFLGRRVYAGFVVVLASILASGLTPRRLARVQTSLGVSAQTVRRWQRWWKTGFVATAAWARRRGDFLPPLDPVALPTALMARFKRDAHPGRLVLMLQFLAPWSNLREGR